ncbi:hypothetical protein J1N35_028894 [Gossypium stocksii]|uniref:Uncharacterized protein n=1 Tax=Gossypium stocksii TaxID=47602 RepID=A0A9D3ZSV1_9ROSI|nr:hypothetical protein J1N35_028894 [Gossypium stocksii]
MARIPEMIMASDLHASVEYIQWYSSFGKPYILGAQSTIVPPHMQRHGAYEPVAEPDPEPDPVSEPKPEPEPEPNQSHSDSHSYHPDLAGMNYFLISSGGGYEFDMFGLFPPQHSTPSSFQ